MSLSKKDIFQGLFLGGASALLPLLGIVLSGIHPLFVFIVLFFPFPLYYGYLSGGTSLGCLSIGFGFVLAFLWGGFGFLFVYGLSSIAAHFFCRRLLLSRVHKGRSFYYPESFLVQEVSLFFLVCTWGLSFLYSLINQKKLYTLVEKVNASLWSTVPGESISWETLLPFVPAGIVLYWGGIQFLVAVLAQKILEKQGKALRPYFSLEAVHLKVFWAYALALFGGIGLWAEGNLGLFCLNTFLVLLIPFWFMGLGIFQVYVKHKMGFQPSAQEGKNQKKIFYFLMTGFYILIFLIPFAHLIIVALGIFEPWFKLRARWSG